MNKRKAQVIDHLSQAYRNLAAAFGGTNDAQELILRRIVELAADDGVALDNSFTLPKQEKESAS